MSQVPKRMTDTKFPQCNALVKSLLCVLYSSYLIKYLSQSYRYAHL